MTKEHEQTDKDDVQRIHQIPALLSFILPGLGQLFQRRFTACLGFLLLYLVTAVLPFLLFQCLIDEMPGRLLKAYTVPLLLLFSPVLIIIFLSVLDAAAGEKGKPSPIRKSDIILTFVYFCFILGILGFQKPNQGSPQQADCINRIKNIGLALYSYREANGSLPPAWTVDKEGRPLHSWRVLLLPYMDQMDLYKKIRLNEPWDSEYNRQFHSASESNYFCPLWRPGENRRPQDSENYSCYSVVVGEKTLFPEQRSVNPDMNDNTSQTILLVERLVPVCWMDPNHEITYEDAIRGINTSIQGPGSVHPGGCHAILVNTLFQNIPETIDPVSWQKMLTYEEKKR